LDPGIRLKSVIQLIRKCVYIRFNMKNIGRQTATRIQEQKA